MNLGATRIWSFATALLIIVVIALGWFIGMAPKLAEASQFDSERLAVQAQNEVSRVQIAQLEADFERIDEIRDELALLRASFPSQAAYDDVVEQLIAAILTQGVELQSVQIVEPLPSSPAVLGLDEVAPEPTLDEDGRLPAGSLLLVSVSMTITGSFDATQTFIDALQRSARFGIVPTWSFTDSGGRGSASITLNIYVVSGEDLVDIEPTDPPAPEPEPSAEPTPESTDPAATEPASSPSPVPTP